MNRIATGIPGLDTVLCGGIPAYATVLLAGAPGTGKSVLTQNLLYNNAGHSTVLYLTTVSEPQIKVLRYQQGFSFFSPDRFMTSVIYHDLGSTIRDQGPTGILSVIDRLVAAHRPLIVAIDSFKSIADIHSSPGELREFMSDLSVRLALWESTVILAGEYGEDELQSRVESAMCDAIILLYGTEERLHQKRMVRVLKMRGSDYLQGEHSFRITSDGIQVHPRLTPKLEEAEPARLTEVQAVQPTGISGFDDMISGGFRPGTVTLVTGPTGTGKSLFSLSWLVSGAEAGEPGLLVTYDEHPSQLIENAATLGWDMQSLINQGRLFIDHVSPVQTDIDEQSSIIANAALNSGIRRVMVDSISSFELGMTDKMKYTNSLWSLTETLRTAGVSLFLVNESPFLFTTPRLGKHTLSYLADNIVFFHYHRQGADIRRLVGVLKTRGVSHHTMMREFGVSGRGPIVRLIEPVLSHPDTATSG